MSKPTRTTQARRCGTRILGRVAGLLVAGILAGCVSKQTARDQARRAYEAGVRDGKLQSEVRRTSVIFSGPVKNQIVPWREGLTLSEAIVTAVYDAPQEPKTIVLSRGSDRALIDPEELLAGAVILLEPGDAIELVP